MLATFLQDSTTTDSASLAAAWAAIAVYVGLLVLLLVGYWKVFTKIGLPGWMGIVPFVNIYMVYKARGQREPVVWLILSLIPCINIVALWFLASDTAEMFDKRTGWKLFLFFIPGLSHIVLGFGSAQADPTKIAAGVGLNSAA